jgi:hypothetical protein
MPKLIRRWEIFISLSVALLSGCSTTATSPVASSFEIHESFTHEKIVAGKMGIGGVVSVADYSKEPAADEHARLLRNALMTERKDFVVLPIDKVKGMIGTDYHQAILDEYARSGQLSLEALRKTQTIAGACSYIVFARIMDNRVEEARQEYTEEVWGQSLPEENLSSPSEDQEESTPEEDIWVELITTRHMTASIDVYDLLGTMSVFHGTLNISESVHKEYAKTEDRNIAEMFLRLPTHVLLETALQPKPPATDRLLGKLFITFSKNMP